MVRRKNSERQVKTKEHVYDFISMPHFRLILGDEEDKFIAQFLYYNDLHMMVYIKKIKDAYQVHYPAAATKYITLCENMHLDFKRKRQSYKELTPYFFYFKSASHARIVEKEVKLAFRRWLKSEKE
jgi:hypothetical protein